MTMQVVIEAWETWDGTESKHQYQKISVESQNEAEAAGLEFAFTLLKPYMNEIYHYAEYMFQKGYDYDDIIHQTMLECARYELWVKA